jgi:hypothetical protein
LSKFGARADLTRDVAIKVMRGALSPSLKQTDRAAAVRAEMEAVSAGSQ